MTTAGGPGGRYDSDHSSKHLLSKSMFGDVFGQRGDYSKGIVYGSRRTYLVSDGSSPVSPPPELMTKIQARQKKHHTDMDQHHFKTRASVYFGAGIVDSIERPEQNQTGSKASKVSMFQRNAKSSLMSGAKSKNMIVIEKFSTTNRSAWSEEVQAGCKIYVNKETGEVCDECPWLESIPANNGKLTRNHTVAKSANITPKGAKAAPGREKTNKITKTRSGGSSSSLIDGAQGKNRIGDKDSKEYKAESKEDFVGTGSLVYDAGELSNFFEQLDSMK